MQVEILPDPGVAPIISTLELESLRNPRRSANPIFQSVRLPTKGVLGLEATIIKSGFSNKTLLSISARYFTHASKFLPAIIGTTRENSHSPKVNDRILQLDERAFSTAGYQDSANESPIKNADRCVCAEASRLQ